MIPVTGTCDASNDGHTGTAIVATVFLSVFAVLIAFDAWITRGAIHRTLTHTHVVHAADPRSGSY